MMQSSAEDELDSIGQLPTVQQGPSEQGATNSEELKPPKAKKLTPGPPMDAQKGHPDNGGPTPGSEQDSAPASVKERTSSEVLSELRSAAETLLKYHYLRDKDPSIKEFYHNFVKDFKKSVTALSAGRPKTSSSLAAAGTVKVHIIPPNKKMFGADKALLNQVNCEELQMERTDRQGCDIIIVFCPINTRVGSDVKLAMRQVSGEERVILILMHHTRDVDYSTAAKRWSDTFQNVVLDVNVLYHETEPGLLKCPKNTESIRAIRDVLVRCSRNSGTSKTWMEKIFSFPGSLFS